MLGDGLTTQQAWFVNEQLTSAVYEKIIKPGDHVVDAGANSGEHAVVMARLVGSEGIVHAFEPNVSHYQRLLSLSQNIRLWPFAVGEELKLVRLYIPRGECGWATLDDIRATHEDYSFEVIDTVQARIGDFEEIDADRLTFVKIDVEGHELETLKGMAKLIDRARPAIVFETPTDPIVDFLHQFGYKVVHFDGEPYGGDRGMLPNRVALPTSSLDCLPSSSLIQDTALRAMEMFPAG